MAKMEDKTMTILKTLGAGVFLVSTLVATGAFSKAHNQGNTEVPGANVGTETVATSQALGSLKGQRPEGKGPGPNNPAVEKADGRSEK
jgi:hypothetical protein